MKKRAKLYGFRPGPSAQPYMNNRGESLLKTSSNHPRKTAHSDTVYRSALERLDDHAVFKTNAAGEVLEWRKSAWRLTQLTQESMLGDKVGRHLISSEAVVQNLLDVAKDTGEAARELELAGKNSKIWVRALILPDEADDNTYLWVLRNLTVDKESAESLRLSQELYTGIFESSMGCVKLLDSNACLLAMNEPGKCLMEIDDFSALQGREWITLWPEEYHTEILKQIKVAKDGGVGHFQGFCPTVKGTPKWWDVVISSVAGEEISTFRLLSVSRDITEQKLAEAALEKSQERLMLIARATNDAIWDWDLVSGQLWWNEGFKAQFGQAPTQSGLDIEYWYERIHPDDRDRIKKGIHRLIRSGGKEWLEEYQFLRADGLYASVYDRGYVLHDSEGKPRRMIGSMLDISERKRYESDLMYQRALLQAQNDATPDAIIVVSPEGDIMYFNKSFITMWNIPDDVINSKDDKAALEYAMQQVKDPATFIQRINQIYEHPDEISHEEVVFRDGRIVERYGVPVRGSDGTYFGWTWYFRDISRRRRAEDDLRMQNELTKSITDNATTGLLIMDDSHRCSFMNPAAEAIIGHKLADIIKIDKPLHQIIHHKRPDGTPYPERECPIDRALPGRNQMQGEELFVRPDGSFYPVAFTASPIIRDNKAVGTVIEVRDITNEKEAERKVLQLNSDLERRVAERTMELTATNKELARSNVELQDFAYVASHDLQEPLRKITAFAGLLESDYKDELPADAHKYLEGLQKSSGRMRKLINDLLTYSRVTTQAQPFERISLNTICEEVLEDVQASIEDTKAVIDVAPLCTVEADPLQMRMLLQNLISNAIKYTPEDTQPHIQVSCSSKDGKCTVTIKDNGIGFKQVYADKIFTIFQRLHGKDEYEGTGVGLAICKKIIDRHGGTITAESKEGEGSVFSFMLPEKQEVSQ